MNEKIQKTENNFAKRTDVLGVYNVNGAQTTISRAEDADLVFDIALNGKLLSLALKRSQHNTGKSPYTRCMDGGCAPAYKGEHLVDYSLRFDLDGISAGEQISFIGAKYDEWNDSPIPSYDVDIKKGIPQSEHKKIGEILKSAYSVTDKPITAKIRIGWDNETKNAVKTATTIEKNGAVAITVHGRTRAQMYAPPVDTEAIREVKNAVSIPVIGNGDITDGQSAALMFEKTNCDLLMVGRGALGRPWVFAQINAYMTDGRILPEPPVSERMRVMVNHVKKICEYKGEKIGIKEARKHAAWYIKGIRNAAEYRQSVGLLESIEQLEEIAYKISISN